MDIRILKYFLAVAQEESVTKAAGVLHTSQPNLSRQLNELEAQIGKKLFERGSRKISLTEVGFFLRKRAQEIIELTERTEAELGVFDSDISGTVYIGAAETHAMHLVADVIMDLNREYPHIRFDILSGSTTEVAEQLDKGLLDFGIFVESVNLQEYEYLRLPVVDTWGVLMRRDSPLAELKTIHPEDIRDKPLLFSHQARGGNVLTGWLGRDCEELNIVLMFNLITTPAMMVESGLGYVFTFDRLVNTTGDSKLCFRPLEPKLETGLFLVWKKHQLFTKAAAAFLEQVRSSLFGIPA